MNKKTANKFWGRNVTITKKDNSTISCVIFGTFDDCLLYNTKTIPYMSLSYDDILSIKQEYCKTCGHELYYSNYYRGKCDNCR